MDRIGLKNHAKARMRETRPSIFVITLWFLVISAILGLLANEVSGLNPFLHTAQELPIDLYYDHLATYSSVLRPGGMLLAFCIVLFSTLFHFGYISCALKVSRGECVTFRNLFDGFAMPLKLIGLNIVMGVLIFLWSCLLIVPGIIAAYRYRLSVYLLLDNPEWGILDCIGESKRLMRGHKLHWFVLDLSFIGWALLAGVIQVFVAGIATTAGLSATYINSFNWLDIWLLPYTNVTYAQAYNLRVGHTPDPDSAPCDPDIV